MDWDQVQVNWNHSKVSIKRQWSALSDSQLDAIAGHRDGLAERIQQSYGWTTDEVEKQISNWQQQQNTNDYPIKNKHPIIKDNA